MTQIRGRICHTGDSYDHICHTCREFFNTWNKYVSIFHTSNNKSERIHKSCHAYVFVRSVQIPLKFRCRYITPSRALHLLTCMLVRSCWHKKSWSYFDNFNEVFNACFVCLFCIVNYKRKNSYEFTLYYKGEPPSSRISNSENRFPSAVSLPWVPLNINTNTRTRWARPKTYHQDKPS